MSSNSPPVAPSGAGVWLIKTLLPSRFAASSGLLAAAAAAAVEASAKFLPGENIMATTLPLGLALVTTLAAVPQDPGVGAGAETLDLQMSSSLLLGRQDMPFCLSVAFTVKWGTAEVPTQVAAFRFRATA